MKILKKYDMKTEQKFMSPMLISPTIKSLLGEFVTFRLADRVTLSEIMCIIYWALKMCWKGTWKLDGDTTAHSLGLARLSTVVR